MPIYRKDIRAIYALKADMTALQALLELYIMTDERDPRFSRIQESLVTQVENLQPQIVTLRNELGHVSQGEAK